MPIATGTRLGRYDVLAKLGEGGMGEVYLARDTTELERTVAIKVLPKDVATDPDRLRRFIQEAKTASSLNHPNILTVYEIGEADSSRFFATEYVEGETLRQRMSRSRLTLRDSLDIAVQIASALVAAHRAGVVHRDIKPENVMLREDGIVKVLDFGLAKPTVQPVRQSSADSEAATRALVNTTPGMIMGTAQYMSPEQARGLTLDAHTDIWSLGVVLYEMLTGRLPFEGRTASDTIASILGKDPPPLMCYFREAPTELEWFITKALTKDKEERYQTAKEMLVDLRRLKQKLDVEAEIERTHVPEAVDAVSAATSGRWAAVETAHHSAASTVGASTVHSTSSAEYIVTEIKRHKLGVIVALTLLIIAGVSIAYLNISRPSRTGIDSLAVLPLANTSVDPDAEWLSDGLTESLIDSLSQLPGVKVISLTSVMRYKGQQIDPQVVGRELGVRALLTGRIVQRGDGLLISTELVDAPTKSHIWGEQYSKKITDLLPLQEEIAKEVSENLRVRLSGEERKRVVRHYTDNPEAYELYLKGRYYWNKRTTEGLNKGIEYFQQAIELDPIYALAYSGLADSYNLLSTYGVLSANEAFPKAKAAATTALKIDDTLAEAHASLAGVLDSTQDSSGAERELKRAIELNPNYATAHHWYGNFLQERGRFDEALVEVKRAQELDPLSLIIRVDVGDTLYLARRYDQAIEQFRRTLELDPNFYRAHLDLGQAYLQKKMYEEAIAETQKAIDLSGRSSWALASLGHIYAAAGRRSEAQKVLEELTQRAKQDYVPPYFIALVYTGLDEKDRAFELLDKAHEERGLWIGMGFPYDPMLDNLRGDPRFQDLARRAGPPQ
jgi:serine/threonine protein kinase/tetratricopeptide (TPR) repeat protein